MVDLGSLAAAKADSGGAGSVAARYSEHAAELGTGVRNVKFHRSHVMQKMRVSSLTELVLLAERLGIGEARD